MEQKKSNFRLKLNLFDGIVLVLAVLVGGMLLWKHMKPAPAPGSEEGGSTAIHYTLRIQRWQAGTGELIRPGHVLVDATKNFELGTVVSAQVVPNVTQVLDEEDEIFRNTQVQGLEDVIVELESVGKVDEEKVKLDSGFSMRVGTVAYVSGEGYMGSGPIIRIEREEQA